MFKKLFIASFISIILLGACQSPNDSNNKESTLNREDRVFLFGIPGEKFETLTVQDLPSVRPYYNDPTAIVYDNAVFFLAHPFVIQYNFAGKLLAYTNNEVLGCAQSMANIGDYLYVGCFDKGVYKIDLLENKIVDFYGLEDGLNNVQNIRLTPDGDTLWVGTFQGVGEIDTLKNSVKFYTTELGIPATSFGSRVYARNGDVWAVVNANAYSKGGISHYDRESGRWTAYSVSDFKTQDLERIDFNNVIVSEDGVYVTFQEQGPGNVILKKFSPTKNEWITVYSAPYEKFEAELPSYLPLISKYTDFQVEIDENGYKNLRVFRSSKWVNVSITYKLYGDLIRLNDEYYLLHNRGIDVLAKTDTFPRALVESNAVYIQNISFKGDVVGEEFQKTAKLFLTDDKKYLVFYSHDSLGMGGEVIDTFTFGVGVYNLQTKTFFDKSLQRDDLAGISQEADFEFANPNNIVLEYDSKNISLILPKLGKIVIDPSKKTTTFVPAKRS